MRAQHTPGPWRADLNVDDDKFGIFPDTGRMEFGLCWLSEFLRPEINAANAALIAAAPDLLEVLQAIVRSGVSLTREQRIHANAAVDKATGAA